ncbi:MFS transporter [Rhodococcus opacus]|uniref:Putative proline/betaine transporter n=1 Tax=Rhodococcus opacus TaxID=37919 RepID=A0A076EY32_RHOOP|nr:MFS transporter [Rhodococcus opacus]AII08279.1 MFS transporter [Rhodococcus opacus]
MNAKPGPGSEAVPNLRGARRAGFGALIGTTVEWYDFFIFGTAAALAFGPVFFPSASPTVGLLASFATFWSGFLARPLGGVIFGHLGDRIGRKKTLITTLVLMGLSSTAIGLLPGYASIGLAAPVLLILLRMVQGLALGGEWGGAVLIAAEHAPPGRRMLFGAFAQQGSPVGNILATLAFLGVSTLPADDFAAWGWRIPFLFSAVLLLVGLIIRIGVEESPEFLAAKEHGEISEAPALETIRTAPAPLLLGIGAAAIGVGGAYFMGTFMVAWTTTDLGVSRSTILSALLLATVVQFFVQPIGALLADRFGGTRIMVTALVATVILTPLVYALVGTGEIGLIYVGLALGALTSPAYFAVLAGFLAQAFDARIRYTGISLAYQLSATLIGGMVPFIAQWLLADSGIAMVAGYHVALTLLTLACVVMLARRTRTRTAPQSDPADISLNVSADRHVAAEVD